MATFANTTSPTPFAIFDTDTSFQTDSDSMITFVKRKLGDDILSVELTSKMIWGNFEEACLEYSSILNQYQEKPIHCHVKHNSFILCYKLMFFHIL